MNHMSTDTLVSTAEQLLKLGLIQNPGDFLVIEDQNVLVPRLDKMDSKGSKVNTDSFALEDLLHRPADSLAIHPQALASLCRSPKNSVMILSRGPYTRLAAAGGRSIRPVLDDLAQIVGPRLSCRTLPSGGLKLGQNRAVLVPGTGCLCLADNCYEAMALAMVVEKSCLADFGSRLAGSFHPISFFEALLMRFIYLTKYRKAAARHKSSGTSPGST